MKKFMMLAALLAGGVPSLSANPENAAMLRGIDNLTNVEFTYHAPNGSEYSIAPQSRRILSVSLHDSERSHARSKSYLISRTGMVMLCLDYQKSVELRCPPKDPRLQGAQLQQRLWLALHSVIASTGRHHPRMREIFEYDSGLNWRPLESSCSSYDLCLTLAGDTLESSYIRVVETNAVAPVMPPKPMGPFIPSLSLSCSPCTSESSPRLVESPH